MALESLLTLTVALMLSGLNQFQGFYVSTDGEMNVLLSLLNLTIVNFMCMAGKAN